MFICKGADRKDQYCVNFFGCHFPAQTSLEKQLKDYMNIKKSRRSRSSSCEYKDVKIGNKNQRECNPTLSEFIYLHGKNKNTKCKLKKKLIRENTKNVKRK